MNLYGFLFFFGALFGCIALPALLAIFVPKIKAHYIAKHKHP